MSGPKFPPDSPSPPSNTPHPSPIPSKQDQEAAKIAKKKLAPTPEHTELPTIDAVRISEASPLSIPPKTPLMTETVIHRALKVYDTIKIPPNTTFVLTCEVFDGVGDLEHVIHMAHHLKTMRKTEEFKVIVFLVKGDLVPEIAWNLKWAELLKLGFDGIYQTKEPQSKRREIKFDELRQEAPKTTNFCQIMVSTYHPLTNLAWTGFITEYLFQPEFLTTDHVKLLNLGLFLHTAGVWMEDDSAFSQEPLPLSNSLQKLIFGSPLSEEKQKTWEVGCAYLRDDRARLIWINIRLHQVKGENHCTLSLSPFTNYELAEKRLRALATQYRFDHCILVDRDGVEKVISSGKTIPGRTLRIIHPFINEEDLPALIQRSAKGSLGGAGDTSCVRGLLGEHPLFVEVSSSTKERWEEAIPFFEEKGFPQLAIWFEDCIEKNYHNLIGRLTPELAEEWQEFRSRARDELEASPWVTRYIRRCALASSTKGEQIKPIEVDYMTGKINQSEYDQAIRHLA